MLAAIATPAPGAISASDLCQAMRTPGRSPAPAWARGLDRVLSHDSGTGLMEVQAGVPWAALAGVLGAECFSGAVGQSAAENPPGPDGRPLVAHVRALTLATADGQLRRASLERDPQLFGLALGGFGAFGPFYSLTLDLASLAAAFGARIPPVQALLPPAGAAERCHALELLLRPESADAAAARVRDAIAERRYVLRRMEARRALPEEVTLLRWARREYVALRIEFHARPTLGASVAAAQLCSRLIDLAIEVGGSFMPAWLPAATRAQAEACYPMLGEFLAEKRRLDPDERAGTTWARSVHRVWRAERCRVRFAGA